MTSKKYLIVSSVDKGGGIALDVGFIGDLISKNNQVAIITTRLYYDDSEVYYFNKQLNYTSLDQILYNKSVLIRVCAKILCLLKRHPEKGYNRINNKIFQKIFDLRKRRSSILKEEMTKYDKIIICNQLTGDYVKEIVSLAPENAEIIHRVTGQITDAQLIPENKEWLQKTTCFIHHSERNKTKLAPFLPHSKHHIIDQCAYNQDRFLNIPKRHEVKRFFTFSRLHDLKQIDLVITAFKKLPQNDISLHIYGDGPEEMALKTLSGSDQRIHFYGNISFKNAHEIYAANDCLIISSRIEAGPYTGIEAMASSTLMISTRVGAMEVRLPEYPFFYDGSVEDLILKIKEMCALSAKEIDQLSTLNKNRYLADYNEEEIKLHYKNAILSASKF
ncbi:MAG: glycosyltransferase involved in cell wall biosynthesis [Dokdonia sp.]|jgi:glycosyltransferase involved in cell wall biosynthesis